MLASTWKVPAAMASRMAATRWLSATGVVAMALSSSCKRAESGDKATSALWVLCPAAGLDAVPAGFAASLRASPDKPPSDLIELSIFMM
ncbi:protein of unknown function [Sterolibacterium denitrificans]|uniref:Uncharacterized protein n=1 Tax=Sterolibacterium denitrificans TaxID=157592 RepID=A0A7Z7HSP9_9PROT|nr:protein of unknown function [Sterolibacterium denitrificans]